VIYVFGDFELDDRLYGLHRAGQPIEVEPKVFDVLAYLLHSRDRTVSRDELIEQLWPGQVVSEAALTQCVARARKALQDDGMKQRFIKTYYGRGYHFVAEVAMRTTAPPVAMVSGLRNSTLCTDNPEAYDAYLCGWDFYYRFTSETNAQARSMFTRAIELDPKYAAAYINLGWTYFLDCHGLEHAFDLAQQARTLDPSLPYPHALLGEIYLMKKQYALAIAETERAIALDPHCAVGYATLAEVLTFAGQPRRALDVVAQAMRLDPFFAAYYAAIAGHAYRLLGRYEDAMAALQRPLTRNPNFLFARGQMAAVYSEVGREEQARAEIAAGMKLAPHASLEAGRRMIPYQDRAVLERFLTALRKVGLK
jgi:DNA-binding winged helix-turn-helix (wHTH) protein/tetratricopeptide (TPR) repeat protein